MTADIKIGNDNYLVDFSQPQDISIPMNFNGEQPNTYNVTRASAEAYRDGTFVGDVGEGGGCNFQTYHLTPHCNGTHTECIGHITKEKISINKTLKKIWFPATLVSLTPKPIDSTNDKYIPDYTSDDLLITSEMLKSALKDLDTKFLEALIIRTLPNGLDKINRQYADKNPAFFSIEAMQYLCSLGVKHLLVDLPSVDRALDEGKLSAHHVYWNMPFGTHDLIPEAAIDKTITEMIFVPDTIVDGQYLLNIQIPPFEADAAPSRPFLYKLG